MMWVAIVLQIFIGLSKAISDIVDHSDNWSKSIFHKCNPIGFCGSKDKTWVRKYKNKFLLQNVFVGFTDLWHFANSIRFFSWIAFCLLVSIYFITFIDVLLLVTISRISFHLCYHYILRKDFYVER